MADNYHDLAGCLGRAIGYLLHRSRGETQTHWADVRSTALAIWALSEVVSDRNAPPGSLREIKRAIGDASLSLIGVARPEDGLCSWESEAWDTSLAILALVSSGVSTERIGQAVAWLHDIRRDSLSGVWYDEIWETTLATIALLRAERSSDKPARDLNSWLQPVFRWFVQIPSKDDGEFVCPHYSGFLAWILAEVNASPKVAAIRRTEDFENFRKKTMSTVDFLVKTIGDGGAWSSYTFSNGYICMALSRLARSEDFDAAYRPLIMDWFRDHQGSSGRFEDTEDTALAIIALSGLVDLHEEGTRAYQKMTEAMTEIEVSPEATCFLGYCSSAKALASEIKEYFRHKMPSLEIKDWAWDFQKGRLLMPEIERAARECKISVFLVTKDDQTVQSDQTIESPRDNIIFEVGYFAAKRGLERTLLVVEEGTKLPADWGGIIYESFGARTDLDRVCPKLLDAIKKALNVSSR